MRLVVACALALVACGPTDRRAEFPFRVVVTSDGRPLSDVRISSDGTELGPTNESGLLDLTVIGMEGATVPIEARCPSDLGDPEAAPLTLQRVRGIDPRAGSRRVRIALECRPLMRNGVLLVRSGGREGIPVHVDGRELARTDAHGLAHVELRYAPHSRIEVTLRTDDYPELSPRSPTTVLVAPDASDVLVVDQTFTQPPTEAPRVRVRRPREPRLPIRVR